MGGVSRFAGPVLALLRDSSAWLPAGQQSDTARTFATQNPASAEVIAHVRGCSLDDYEQINFPVAVWAWNAFIAVIACNSVAWKPSPKAPPCAIGY